MAQLRGWTSEKSWFDNQHEKEIITSAKHPDALWICLTLPFSVLFLRSKVAPTSRLWLNPKIAEATNEWNYISTPTYKFSAWTETVLHFIFANFVRILFPFTSECPFFPATTHI
jgi:hypothetical protein